MSKIVRDATSSTAVIIIDHKTINGQIYSPARGRKHWEQWASCTKLKTPNLIIFSEKNDPLEQLVEKKRKLAQFKKEVSQKELKE